MKIISDLISMLTFFFVFTFWQKIKQIYRLPDHIEIGAQQCNTAGVNLQTQLNEKVCENQ